MARIGTIVGWDGSPEADEALAWAADREDHAGGALHVLRVLDLARSTTPVEQVAAARSSLAEMAKALAVRNPGLETLPELAVGDVVAELDRAAGHDRLLVLGASRAGRVRRPEARRIPIALAGRAEGVTAVVPRGPTPGGTGVLAVVSGRAHSRPTVDFAAETAAALGERLVIQRLHDPHDLEVGEPALVVESEIERVREHHPELDVSLASGWVSSPYGLLSRSDAVALLVLEGSRPSAAPPRYSFERWLAGQARAPFVVVAESMRPPAATSASAKLALAV